MAKLLFIPLFFLTVSVFGQGNPLSDSSQNDFEDRLINLRRSRDSMTNPIKYASTLEEFLLGSFPENSTKDGRWVYYKDNANIQKLNKPEVSKVIPDYSFYKVTLTNFLGYHINSSGNLVLFDSIHKKLIHPEPVWYSDDNKEFINLFIGKKFIDSTSLMSFVYEFQDLLKVGSTGKYENTVYSPTKVTFDDTYKGTSGTEIWRHLEIILNDNRLTEFHSINPKMNERVIVK